MNINVFEKEKKYIKTIHINSCEKVQDIKEITGLQDIDFGEVETIENITNFFMKKAEKSDWHFLNWMYAIGNHIKKQFLGEWVLVHYKGIDIDRQVPAVVNPNQEIWEVGNFCYRFYYSKNRMKGISFSTFYKLEIDRAIWKPKLKDINIPMEDVVFIEQEI